MKYAIFNGKKTEASKGAKGLCSICGSDLIAKCGDIKVNHWAHKGERNCDSWWENETIWHRTWKDQFPIDWQEVVQFDDSGEKHIADVKTENGWVLEFQHSYLNPAERSARNTFYKKLVWVVDGLRRKRDKQQFLNAIEESSGFKNNPNIRRIHYVDECRILNEWHDCSALVFFDFEELEKWEGSFLWLLLPRRSNSDVYLMRFPRNEFIKMQLEGSFDDILKENKRQSSDTSNIIVEKKPSTQRKAPNIYQRKEAYKNRYKNRF